LVIEVASHNNYLYCLNIAKQYVIAVSLLRENSNRGQSHQDL
jgi:hypothetical protein